VPLHLHHASVPERLAAGANPTRGETVEEAARILRYEVFASVIRDGHADSVLTAHTLDDQAETVLMKLLRGAWTEGLSGIHPIVEAQPGKAADNSGRPGRILRPLLSVRRADLEAYLRARNQPWRTDSTNADHTYTRNRIRHHLLPILREYNPAVDHTLANMAELARDDEGRWQAELVRILPQVLLPGKPVRGGGRAVSTSPGESAIAIEIERLRAFDPALRRRVVRAAARKLGARLGFEETNRILALAGFGPEASQPARSGASIDLLGGVKAERTARELQFRRVSR
jgi:tRNA(Ile)-lysidine synthase